MKQQKKKIFNMTARQTKATVEIASNDDWTYKWNDRIVTEEEYKKLCAGHAAYVKELEEKELEESNPVKTKRGKK